MASQQFLFHLSIKIKWIIKCCDFVLLKKRKRFIKLWRDWRNGKDKKFSTEARFGYIKPANEAKLYVKAYEKYEEILKIDPYNSIANYWVGVSYYNVKKYETAAKYFELVVNMNPFDYDANHMYGWTLLNLGRNADAKNFIYTSSIQSPR